jgi:hypothetical protein
MQTNTLRNVAASIATLLVLVTCACSSSSPAEPQGSTTSHLDEADADQVCDISCSLAAAAACASGVEAACDKDIYCEGLCGYLTKEQKTEQVCIRVSSREEVCCQNYYGCQDIVDTSCREGQPC